MARHAIVASRLAAVTRRRLTSTVGATSFVLRGHLRGFVMWCTCLLLTLFVTVQGRAVNISNTWVLPEEGFPVFYRYFRDRISWYEADAVCQFHHANLVTVDTTAQYDAVRAYLKELDISSAVWVGLIRSNPDGDFTWTDYRGLSGEGYWSSAPDSRSAPLCAAADPAADYRWEARACGGPSVASFICELPVPQWALGNEGCMVRALPALTVLYLPESAAVQLTADCGLAGVKRVQCTGNVKHEDLLRELSCAVEDQTAASPSSTSSAMWELTTDITTIDLESINDSSVEENGTVSFDNNFNQSALSNSTSVPEDSQTYVTNKFMSKEINNPVMKMSLQKPIITEIMDNNNLYSNEIHKQFISEEYNKQTEKEEDDKYLENKKLHDELSRLGNFETIFSLPTDHFVPPLVMAKAKISNDMTALSVEEKLAQQLDDKHDKKYKHSQNDSSETKTSLSQSTPVNTVTNIEIYTTPVLPTKHSISSTTYTESTKYMLPKKYNYKNDDVKSKTLKNMNLHQMKIQKILKIPAESSTKRESSPKTLEVTELIPTDSKDDTAIELTVILKDSDTYKNKTQIDSTNKHKTDVTTLVINNESNDTQHGFITTDEIIKIIIVNDKHHSNTPSVEFATTELPISTTNKDTHENHTLNTTINKLLIEKDVVSSVAPLMELISQTTETELDAKINEENTTISKSDSMIDFYSLSNYSAVYVNHTEEDTISPHLSPTVKSSSVKQADFSNMLDGNDTYTENVNANSTSDIDDFQSPLLSAANEPLHKPIRSRRPQPAQPRATKFNPFRILG